MFSRPEPRIRVQVDPTNPGQFFACCGLLELADRLWRGAEGWFEHSRFFVRALNAVEIDVTLSALLGVLRDAKLHALDTADETASPIWLGSPFELRLDWWCDRRSGGDQMKVWAGSMRGFRIARAMQCALADAPMNDDRLLDAGLVIRDPDDPAKKVEPFYFDARRGGNARSVDIGFAPDALAMTTIAYPYVELLCLVGLQRARPARTTARRVFEYHTWISPLSPVGAGCATLGTRGFPLAETFRFEVGFRTDQRKHKAFMPATRIVRNRDG